jgi:hypothetical protein
MFYVREEDVWRGDLIARPTSVWDNAKSAQLERMDFTTMHWLINGVWKRGRTLAQASVCRASSTAHRKQLVWP